MLGPGSLQENFARERRISEHAVGAVGVLDAVRDRMVEFPLLLAPHEYQPDTIVILDAEQRDFWLTALDSSLSGLVKAVAHSMAKSDADVTARLDEFTAYGRRADATRRTGGGRPDSACVLHRGLGARPQRVPRGAAAAARRTAGVWAALGALPPRPPRAGARGALCTLRRRAA